VNSLLGHMSSMVSNPIQFLHATQGRTQPKQFARPRSIYRQQHGLGSLLLAPPFSRSIAKRTPFGPLLRCRLHSSSSRTLAQSQFRVGDQKLLVCCMRSCQCFHVFSKPRSTRSGSPQCATTLRLPSRIQLVPVALECGTAFIRERKMRYCEETAPEMKGTESNS
jgi:hypothetical protein